MKKYHTWYDARIEEVEVVKETANYVTVVETWMGKQQEHRDAKRSDHGHNYFDTWAEAKAFLIDRIAYLRALDPDQVWSVEDYMQIVEMLPGLLAALDFQPGDAEVLKRVADNEEQMAKFVAGFGKPDMSTANVLRRYQAMAERMEATCHT